MNCERCNSNGRGGNVPATTHQEYREPHWSENWQNRTTERCDRCAQDLRDYANLPSISLLIVVDRPL
jgi:hypothetical protein